MTQQTSPSDVARIFDAELREEEAFEPSFNVAPTDPVTVVLQREDGRVVERHRWGLIPAWADAPSAGARMINARAESIVASPAFRVAFRRRRCIVPADGFYEWLREGGARRPYFIHAAAGAATMPGLLPIAGLWSLWKDPVTGQWISSCAVVTTEASEQLAPIHDRMPVILPRDAWLPWLDPEEKDLGYLRGLLVPARELLDLYPVSSRVNSVRNNGPHLVLPVEQPALLGQTTLFG
jgi:putative SOS response-associated peptidase YedK